MSDLRLWPTWGSGLRVVYLSSNTTSYSHCPRCSQGLLAGGGCLACGWPGSDDRVAHAGTRPMVTAPAPQGWICPKCGESNAPFMPMCSHCAQVSPQGAEGPDAVLDGLEDFERAVHGSNERVLARLEQIIELLTQGEAA